MEPAMSRDTGGKTTSWYRLCPDRRSHSVADVDASNPTSRLAYDELASPQEMSADCRAVGRNVRLPQLERVARAAVSPAPSIHFADYPNEIVKREIRVSDAAARLANALHLHLD